MPEWKLPAADAIREKATIPVFEVKDDIEWLEGPVILGNNDMDSLLDFAKVVESKAMFVQYDYPDFDAYLIDFEDYNFEEFFSEEETDDIFDLIGERNDEIDDLMNEFGGVPVGCSVYVMYEGTPYGMYAIENDLIDLLGETAAEFMARTFLDFYTDEEEEEEEDEYEEEEEDEYEEEE